MPSRTQYIQRLNIALMLASMALAGCGTVSLSPDGDAKSARAGGKKNYPTLPRAGSGRGGYYQDDGPGDDIPEGLLDLPDPEPKIEPYSRTGNRPYVVFGKAYTPFTDDRPFKQRGIGSWYGRKFHGQKTSSGELYDMYKMTAAHPTLPLPSYARVTNLANGKQVIVRVNDRGPFHSSRIMDLSYVAALKLDYLGKGSSQLEIERLLPDEIERMAAARQQQGTSPSTAPPVVADSEPASAAMVKPSVYTPDGSGAGEPPAAASGFYVQLGAYSQSGNAEAARRGLARNWESALPPLEVVQTGAVYRLHSGPFASRSDAAVAAARLQASGVSTTIVQR